MRDEYSPMIMMSGIAACSSFAVICAAVALMHTAVFTCTIKTTQIFSNVIGDKNIISKGSLHFQQYLNGGYGYYDGLLRYRDLTSAKTEFVNITFETEYKRVGKVLRLKTLFVSNDSRLEFTETNYSSFMPPYIKKDAINHISLGYSRYLGFTVGNATAPSFICN